MNLFPKGKYPAVYGVKYSGIVFKIPRCLRRGSSFVEVMINYKKVDSYIY